MNRIIMERVSGDYGFQARDEEGHVVLFDSGIDNGGLGAGVRPMQSLLMALGSCSAIDIVSILKKQRQLIENFRMTIEGEREQGSVPSLWKKIQVNFELSGIIDEEKAKKACALSMEKYCSVAETLRRAGADIKWTVGVNNQ